jgi:hypothetical protein
MRLVVRGQDDVVDAHLEGGRWVTASGDEVLFEAIAVLDNSDVSTFSLGNWRNWSSRSRPIPGLSGG